MDEICMWVFSILNILGSVFNIKKMSLSFAVWTICNIFWILWDIFNSYYSRLVMDIVNLITSIWGLLSWLKDEGETKKKIKRLKNKHDTKEEIEIKKTF